MLKHTTSMVAVLLVASATACERSPAAREDTEHGREPARTEHGITGTATATDGTGTDTAHAETTVIAGTTGVGGSPGGGLAGSFGSGARGGSR